MIEKINKGLSLIGFSDNQAQTFLAVLSLAERRLEHAWRITEEAEADVFILVTEKIDAEPIITSKNLPRERCLFCTQQHPPEFGYEPDILFISSGGLPQLSSLVKVLNYKAANINNCEQIPADSSSLTPIVVLPKIVALNNDGNFFDPDQSFLKTLLQNTADFLTYRFTSPAGSIKLYVDFVKKIYYCETGLKNLKPYFIIKDAVIIEVLSEIEWQDVIEQAALTAQPLANLIWYVAFELSNGRLLLGHSNEDNIYLTRWPDLGVEGCGKYIRLAAFMRNNVTSLIVTASKTHTPLTDVYSFYNACYLTGLVEKSDKSELYAKILDNEKQQLLDKITNRLKEINNPKGGC